MDNIVKLFGERVRLLRRQKNYSQERLSELAGLHPTYIGQVERAEKKCTIETANRIAAALGCTLSELLAEPTETEQKVMLETDTEKQHIISELVQKLLVLDTDKLRKRASVILDMASID